MCNANQTHPEGQAHSPDSSGRSSTCTTIGTDSSGRSGTRHRLNRKVRHMRHFIVYDWLPVFFSRRQHSKMPTSQIIGRLGGQASTNLKSQPPSSRTPDPQCQQFSNLPYMCSMSAQPFLWPLMLVMVYHHLSLYHSFLLMRCA